MRMIRGALGIILSTLVAGTAMATNWPDYRHDPLNTGVSPDSITLPLRIRWQKNLGGIVTNIVVHNGVVYTASTPVGAGQETIVAYDLATGANIWTVTTPASGTAESQVATDGTRLFVTGPDFTGLSAYNLANGALLWTTTQSGWMQHPLSVDSGVLFASGTTKGVIALDPVDGHTLWYNPLPVDATYVKTAPVHLGADIYIGTGYSWKWSSINQSTGLINYSVSAPNYITMSPAYAGGMLFGLVETNTLYALRSSDLGTAWTKNIGYSRYCSPAVADGKVLIASETGKTLYSLAQADGATGWTATLSGKVFGCGVTVAGDYAFVADDSKHIYAVDRTSGVIAWSTTLPGTVGMYVWQEPVPVDGVLLMSDDGGGLIAFETAVAAPPYVPPTVTPTGTPEEKGYVKIVGGIRGYLDLKRGELANILVKPTKAGEIRVRIYDGSGVLIWERKVAYKGTGMETIQWNGTDSSGKQVAPGIYPIVIDAPGIHFKDKLGVMK